MDTLYKHFGNLLSNHRSVYFAGPEKAPEPVEKKEVKAEKASGTPKKAKEKAKKVVKETEKKGSDLTAGEKRTLKALDKALKTAQGSSDIWANIEKGMPDFKDFKGMIQAKIEENKGKTTTHQEDIGELAEAVHTGKGVKKAIAKYDAKWGKKPKSKPQKKASPREKAAVKVAKTEKSLEKRDAIALARLEKQGDVQKNKILNGLRNAALPFSKSELAEMEDVLWKANKKLSPKEKYSQYQAIVHFINEINSNPKNSTKRINNTKYLKSRFDDLRKIAG